MRRRIVRILAPLALLLSLTAPAFAQLTTQTIVSGITNIVAFVQDPVIPDTFYIVRQSGTILVRQNGTVLPTPFLDLTSSVTFSGEQGLLGMAFAPAAPNRVFINYTNTNGDTVLARYTRTDQNPLQGIHQLDLQWPDGQRVIDQPAGNHNGGNLAFGPDGMLYIGMGDGGGSNDQFGNGQNPSTLLGKMLRIDVNVPDGDAKGYQVPANNPFVGSAALAEIWDFGLRNPWRYSFDNAALGGTGALVIGDVGQGAREEVDYEPAGRGGRDYGWPIREGTIATPGVSVPPASLPLTGPILDYPRTIGRAITGGYVYRGSALPPNYRGRYFVGDYETGLVASVGLALGPSGEASVVDAIDHTAELGGGALGLIPSFAEDLSGELYIIRINSPGAIYKIVPRAGQVPVAPGGFTSNVNGSNVTLSWNPPTAPLPTQYRLEVGTAPGASNLLVTTIPGNLTSLSGGGVANGLYYARLRGVNGAGTGAASQEIQILVGCTGVPAVPANMDSNVAGTIVTLDWGTVDGITGYVIELGLTPGVTNLSVPIGPAIAGVSGAVPSGTRFFARVRAQNACGVSGPSNEVTVQVP